MMPNSFFNFKQFNIYQEKSAFKVGTDGVLLGACSDVSKARQILDIGSGTGLITLMLAQRCEAEITAIESDYESYVETCENVKRSRWSERIKVIHTDLQNFENENQKFDLIVTNPPFYTDSLRNPDPRKSAARHNDSLTSVELLQGAAKFLYDEGHLQLILPYVEGNLFIAEANRFGLYCTNILKIKPLPTSEIRRLILNFSRIQKKPVERFLTIEHGKRHEFTQEYINLTKDFYLKF
jgi:tRNA1Val (adenine37-N6)-methyltransferase